MRPETRREARARSRQIRQAQGEPRRHHGTRRARPIHRARFLAEDGAGSAGTMQPTTRANDVATSAAVLGAPLPGDVIRVAPNIVSLTHWDRLPRGLLYAVRPRLDWPTLLRRSLSVDVLECPKSHGRLRVAVITEREPVRGILAHLGMPTDAPRVARARDPTDDVGTTRRLRSSPSASRSGHGAGAAGARAAGRPPTAHGGRGAPRNCSRRSAGCHVPVGT